MRLWACNPESVCRWRSSLPPSCSVCWALLVYPQKRGVLLSSIAEEQKKKKFQRSILGGQRLVRQPEDSAVASEPPPPTDENYPSCNFLRFPTLHCLSHLFATEIRALSARLRDLSSLLRLTREGGRARLRGPSSRAFSTGSETEAPQKLTPNKLRIHGLRRKSADDAERD